jgi:pre-mRNA-splicing factor ATP-dependent RNA helicase DHX16
MSDLKTFISDNVVRILGSSDSATVDYVQSLGEYEAQISMFS